jgi:phosphoserine phosphatase
MSSHTSRPQLVPLSIAAVAGILTAAVLPVAARAMPPADPLPSWNDGVAKQAILDFVRRVTDQASPDRVPEAERIAVFDNDGTLWPEYPFPFQAAFALDRLRARAAVEPTLAEDPLVKAALAGDLGPLLAGDRHEGLLQVVGLTHAGMTVEEFQAAVAAWLESAEHPRFHERYDRLTYQPMQELLAFLRASGFKTWIVSGGGADFMRVWSERVYGIPPEQVIGTTGRTRFELRDDGPALVKTLDHLFVDDKAGKPAAIHHFLGRRPIACFGNSDGDLAMLQYTTVGNPRPSLGVIIHHTDADREYAYDAHPKGTGRLVEALAEAPRRGWQVADMKRDWAQVFAAEPASKGALRK